jgi:peptide-methionine (S)-S-oxide reductase
MDADGKIEYALLAGGCFWCVEAAYEGLAGILEAVSGYAGGPASADLESPSYEQVCSGRTGHAEAVRLTFDPSKISYVEILDRFWKIHDPTSLNRQGADVGTQYRSAVFYLDETQRAAAEASMSAEAKRLGRPLATELVPAPRFWPAEDWHQGYYRKHPEAGYCRAVIAPKLAKLALKSLP